MKRHISSEVQCPFYNSEDPQKICCEGVEKNATIHMCFGATTNKSRYKGEYCNNNYSKCILACMLYKKYEDK